MSGYGIAADASGNIYFATGNSDPSGTTYNSVTNISESVAKVSSDLTALLSFFTPSDVDELDRERCRHSDRVVCCCCRIARVRDRHSPQQPAKRERCSCIERKSLGGYNPSGPNNDLGEESIGGCWCGQSYFDAASDSVRRIVASGGNNVTVWKVLNPPVKLVAAGTSPSLPGGQDPGFLTTVSSDGI